ncbi:glycosyltransferase family 2 protein [Schaalia sp. lx-260]|uniref:glycosyltransferase family 2 protein n=1 Tax=Schaalia sp. lx-260 TaxID=2899082 RepID=UPI001E29F2E4|nr:glycosyltransferase family 2 protein [Schaalia sp. lx-260]MCD4548951.1 glycosyltransferase family 2 protein [Schaalia sp. lx-260]
MKELRVAAVVVTYNRCELLQKTLAALEAQTYAPAAIIVVDNASTDDTQHMLAARDSVSSLQVHRLAENTGGAGGFNAGIKIGYTEGYDAFWVMDDDTAPRPEALEKLVTTLHDAAEFRGGDMPSYAASMVLWTDGSACEMNFPTPTWDWVRPVPYQKNWIDIDCASFVSCLVTREAVAHCGFPYKEYFIWFDDAEYTYRLSKWRPGIFVTDSYVDHLTPENKGVFWSEVTEANFWKYSRGARNQVSAGISLRKPRILVDLFAGLYRQLRGAPVSRKLKLKLTKAAFEGFFQRPRIEYPEQK